MKFRLDLGCGNNKKDGFIGIDLKNTDADIYADLTENLPIKDSVIDEVYCHSVLEHMPFLQDKNEHGVIHVMKEIHRVCKNGAKVSITVPHWTSKNVWTDPTHYRGFTEKSMNMFCSTKRSSSSYFFPLFKLKNIRFITFGRKRFIPFKKFLSSLGLNLIDDITFELEVKK